MKLTERHRALTAFFIIACLAGCFFLAASCSKEKAEIQVLDDHEYPEEIKKIDLVLVMDGSSSMKRTDPDDLQKEAAKIFIGLLPPGCQAGVIEFSQGAEILRELAPIESPEQKKEIMGAIDRISEDSSYTDVFAGAQSAVEMLERSASPQNQQIIILMTDGGIEPDPAEERFRRVNLPGTNESIAEAYEKDLADETKNQRSVKNQYQKLIRREVDLPALMNVAETMRRKNWEFYCVALSTKDGFQSLKGVVENGALNRGKQYIFYAEESGKLIDYFSQIVESVLWIDDGPIRESFSLEKGEKKDVHRDVDPFINYVTIAAAMNPEKLPLREDQTAENHAKAELTGFAPLVTKTAFIYNVSDMNRSDWEIHLQNSASETPLEFSYAYHGMSNLFLRAEPVKKEYGFVGRHLPLKAGFAYLPRFPAESDMAMIKEAMSNLKEQEVSVQIFYEDEEETLDLAPEGKNFSAEWIPKIPGPHRAVFTGKMIINGKEVQRSSERRFYVKSRIAWAPADGASLDFGDVFIGWSGSKKSEKDVTLKIYSTLDEETKLNWDYGIWEFRPENAGHEPVLNVRESSAPPNGEKKIPLVISLENYPSEEIKKGYYMGELIAAVEDAPGHLKIDLQPIKIRFRVIGWWERLFPYLTGFGGILIIIVLMFLASYVGFWFLKPYPFGRIYINGKATPLSSLPKFSLRRLNPFTKNVITIGNSWSCDIRVRDVKDDVGVNLKFKGRGRNKSVRVRAPNAQGVDGSRKKRNFEFTLDDVLFEVKVK